MDIESAKADIPELKSEVPLMITTNTIKTYNLTAMSLPFVLTLVLDPKQADAMPNPGAIVDQVGAFLKQVDQDFSAFKPTSLVSRFQRGELAEDEYTEQFKEVLDLATKAEATTDGAFDPYYSGKYDPTGMVKGWAIEQAFNAYLAPLIRHQRVTAAVLNGAGDMRFGVMAGSDFIWNIGIGDPNDSERMIYQLDIQNGAMATSGIGPQGNHISLKGFDATLEQATIISDNLIEADVLALAAVAMGKEAFLAFSETHEANGLLVDQNMTEIEL